MGEVDHLRALRDDGAALAAAAGRGLDPPVPACEGWSVADLVLRTGMVHRHKLEEADPETRVWTFYRPDQTVAFWRRRMAQETAVHRVDAEAAHGEPRPVPAALAADGVAELLEVFLWGREPADQLERAGDPALLARIRELAAAATQ